MSADRGMLDGHMADTSDELTIDELARVSGMTVRNIRSHATRGLLPPPEVRARTGYYGPEHVARLKLIQELQANGYNLAAIKHLLGRTQEGSAEDVLGFARALLAPFEDERPEVIDEEELTQRYGSLDDKARGRALKLGIVVPLGEGRYEVPSPTLLRAGDALVELGIPLDRALSMLETVSKSTDNVAEQFTRLFLERVWKPFADSGRPEEQLPEVRAALDKLRPLATEVVVALFHQRMTRKVERAFGRELEKAKSR
jgi:DNA-binding transcriptional MerR regulator